MKNHIRRYTYHNLMIVIHKIEKKGYDLKTAEMIAKNIFAEYQACPNGLSIEQRIEKVLTKEEYDRMYIDTSEEKEVIATDPLYELRGNVLGYCEKNGISYSIDLPEGAPCEIITLEDQTLN